MNVVFAGQTGLNKTKVLENLSLAIANLCGEKTDLKKMKADKILGIYEAESIFSPDPFGFNTWLEIPDRVTQERQWTNGVESLLRKIKQDKHKNNFFCLHGVYRKYREYFSPINLELLQDFNPDIFVTFIDDTYDISWRLRKKHDLLAGDNFDLAEIIEWRAVEVMVMDRLSKFLDSGKGAIPHYVVAIKHPANMLAKLLLYPKTMRLYTAYPISGVRDKEAEENLKLIDTYKKYMHENYVCFDPSTIDEFWLHRIMVDREEKKFEEGKGSGGVILKDDYFEIDMNVTRWPMRSKIMDLPQLSDGVEAPEELKLKVEEVTTVAESAKQQIETRDYRLIEQANAMSAYRPAFKKIPSTGVNREIDYARLTQTMCYQFWNEEEDGDPANHPFSTKGNFTSDEVEFRRKLEYHQSKLNEHLSGLAHNGEFVGC